MEKRETVITVPFSEEQIERLRVAAPEIKIRHFALSQGDEIPPEIFAEAEILYTAWAMPEPDEAPRLRWIQFHYAGLDHVQGHALLQQEVQISTLSGVAATQMAEYALMSILALGHRLSLAMQDQQAATWSKGRFERFRPLELRGSTVGIVGYGSVGREIARLVTAFGAQVLATKRDLKHLYDRGYLIEGLGDPGADLPQRLYPPTAVASMAALCDYLVITLPLTEQTRGMIGEKVFSKMRATSFLVDLSRGGIVDHGALLAALQSGQLAGAALDVFPIEPLPEVSPLWQMENVIITPHVAWFSDDYNDQAMDMFIMNLRRYLDERPLQNLYDNGRNY